MTPRAVTGRRSLLAVAVVVAALVVGACDPYDPIPVRPPSPVRPPVVGAPAALDTKTVCAYTWHHIDRLATFSREIGRDVNCALVYNNASPDWPNLVQPWFVVHRDPNYNWAAWARAVPGRRLIISQSLIPAQGMPADWRARGARGDYDGYARQLAANLVAAGLGNSVIRLAHEANGVWGIDNVGTTATDIANWKRFWARTVTAMRSVPGAHFEFDWCVLSAVRPIPFDQYYPGDKYVDIIGIDDYDSPVNAAQDPNARWAAHRRRPYGLDAMTSFAAAHRKPLSIPEWGLWSAAKAGAGDDPAFIDGIASVVRNNVVRYHSYFESDTGQSTVKLANAPRSLAAYVRHFAPRGDALRR